MFANLNKRLAAAPKVEPSERDMRMLTQADKCAKASLVKRKNMGAVIYRGSTVLGSGSNVDKTHPWQHRWCPRTTHIHAETRAILSCFSVSTPIAGTTIAVSRIDKHGMPAVSYPCDDCLGMLVSLNIARIVCYDEHGLPTAIDVPAT